MAKGNLRLNNVNGWLEDVVRSEFKLEPNAVYAIPVEQWRKWNDMAVNLLVTAADDDLELTTGTLGTDFPSIGTGDLDSAGATTRYAAVTISLPPEYEPAGALKIRVIVANKTNIPDTSSTVDIEAYPSDEDATASSDLVSTSALSIQNLTFANKDFTLTPTDLNPGDEIHIRIAIAVNDASTGNPVLTVVAKVALLCSIRG